MKADGPVATLTREMIERAAALLRDQEVPEPYYVHVVGMDRPMRVDSLEFREWAQKNAPGLL